MEDTHQLQLMILVSVLAHILFVGAGILLYTFRSQVIAISLPKNAQIVELYDISEVTEIPVQETQPIVPEPQEEQVVALQDISEEVRQPTSTPTPTPTPTPIPKPIPTPTPRPRPTATPFPRRKQVPPEETVVALEVPRRNAVISSNSSQEDLPSPLPKDQLQDKQERQSEISDTGSGSQSFPFSRRLSAETPLTFETENEFSYPEYLEHIKEKIEGIWFPEGTGSVSIYLIIERNGKILKSGVDKGTGVGVNKLRESIIRAIALIKRFHPLPEGYDGMALRVRIVVRR